MLKCSSWPAVFRTRWAVESWPTTSHLRSSRSEWTETPSSSSKCSALKSSSSRPPGPMTAWHAFFPEHVPMDKIMVAADGKPRCRWCAAAPDFLDYHDNEWGYPVRDDHRLF